MQIEVNFRNVTETPTEKEIAQVLEGLCKQLKAEVTRVNVLGNKRSFRNELDSVGIRLKKSLDRAIVAIIGGSKHSFEATVVFYTVDSGTRALTGHEILTLIAPVIKNRTFLLATTKEEPPRANNNVFNGINIPEEVRVGTANGTVGAVVHSEESPAQASSESEEPALFTTFFKKSENVHLAIVALALKWRVGEKFTFEEFASILREELKIVLPQTFMYGGFAGRFMHLGYIKRVNKKSPAEYCLTDAGVDFANKSDETPRDTRKPATKTAGTNPPSQTSLKDHLLGLRRKLEELGTLKHTLATATASLTELKESNLQTEQSTLEAELRTLTERQAQISLRLKEIGISSQRANEIRASIEALKAQIDNPDFQKAEQELKELKELLGL